mmetsp:Transcript_41128/g.97723  ORF Transcript_41128/g.97723 Transcript_41128/m.97723 type:complete len:201 (+) Transcript_41128:98-700(+)
MYFASIGSRANPFGSLWSCGLESKSISTSQPVRNCARGSGGLQLFWKSVSQVKHVSRRSSTRVCSGRGETLVSQEVADASFLPSELASITEPAAIEMAAQLRQIPVFTPGAEEAVNTACVGPVEAKIKTSENPVVLLHGFDSSSLEFRRLYPLLASQTETWAVDLIGWGFTEAGFGRSLHNPRAWLLSLWYFLSINEQVD